MMMNPDDRERWHDCQRTAQGLAEDMDAVLTVIDELDSLDAAEATELCLKVQRTNPHDSPEYALALEARTWLRIIKYLRDQTTLGNLLTTKLEFINRLIH